MGREWSKINEMEKYLVRFLCSFFRVFGGYLEKIEINNDKIIGIISYEDESGKQSFIWKFPHSDFIFDSIILLDYISDNKLIDGDRMILSKEDLFERLIQNGWKEDIVKGSIEFLHKVEIRMLDDGEETDSFFIHF